MTDTHSDSTSLALGTSGTVTGGTDSYSDLGFDSSSQSDTQNGSDIIGDPEGGPAFSASFTDLSIITTSLDSTDAGTLILGTGGSISAGTDTFTFDQDNSDSHFLVALIPPDLVILSDVGSNGYSLTMTGTWKRTWKRGHIE